MRIFFLSLCPILYLFNGLSAQNTLSNTWPAQIGTSAPDYDPSCEVTLSFTLPAGENVDVTAIDISYDFQSVAPATPADQQSRIFFQNNNIEEAIFGSTNTTPGALESYSRNGVNIANGTYPGGTILNFRMRAWNTNGFPFCIAAQNYITANSFTITVYHSDPYDTPLVGVNTNTPQAVLDVNGKIKIADDNATEVEGNVRFNAATKIFEGYNGAAWKKFNGALKFFDEDGDTGIEVDSEFNPDADEIKLYIQDEEAFILKRDDNDNFPILYLGGGTIKLGHHGSDGQPEPSSGQFNVLMGGQNAFNNTTGSENVMLGYQVGSTNTSGSGNIYLGQSSGGSNSGNDNIAIGRETGNQIGQGQQNVMIGKSAGQTNLDKNRNVFIGNESGRNNASGEKNVFIGNQAGYDETGSNILIISNDSLSGQLIYGEFDNRILRIGGSVQIGQDSLITYGNSEKGLLRWNDSNSEIEFFDGSQWVNFITDQNLQHPWEENANFIFTNNDSVGIGTSNPKTPLHISANKDLLIGNDLNNGGNKMLFDASKSALRAGFVFDKQWDTDSLGLYSTAFGLNTLATGIQSFAIGNATKASGASSFAAGEGSEAIGPRSFAIGLSNTSSAANSFSFGSLNQSLGSNSFAGGSNCSVNAQNSFVYGLNNFVDVTSGIGFAIGSNDTVLFSRGIAIGTSNIVSSSEAISMGSNNSTSNFALFSIGNNNVANGSGSWAIGKNSTSSGQNSFAINGTASGFTSTAIKGNASGSEAIALGGTASGQNSTAINGLATGNSSLTIGLNSEANGTSASAFGYNSQASGWSSLALGHSAQADSTYSNAIGFNSQANYFATAIGIENVASGNNSLALGRQNTASGDGATAMGRNSTALGNNSMALGNFAAANGISSFAFGTSTANGIAAFALSSSALADGDYSFALGRQTSALGYASSAIGEFSTASGNYSIALGYNNQSIGQRSKTIGSDNSTFGWNSIALGSELVANSFNEIVLGRYNTNITPLDSLSWNSSDRLFVIGNGTSPAIRKDALVILKNGNSTFNGDIDISGKLEIGANAVIEEDLSGDLNLNANFIPALDDAINIGNGTNRWKNIYATNGTINTSDKRDKTNIVDINYGLHEILKMRSVSFNWKKNEGSDRKLGLIAQDLQKIIPEVIHVELLDSNLSERKDRLGVYYADLIPVLIKAIQEQQDVIDNQIQEITSLKVNEIEAMYSTQKILERINELEQIIKNK